MHVSYFILVDVDFTLHDVVSVVSSGQIDLAYLSLLLTIV